MRTLRLAFLLAAGAAGLSACEGSFDPSPTTDLAEAAPSPVAETPVTSRATELRGIYNFEAHYDAETGGLKFSPLELVGVDGLATSAQALWCGVNVVLDGVPGSNPANSFELVSDALQENEACFGGTYPSPAFLFEADGALCANVTARTFYGAPLDRVYAQIVEFTGSSDYIPYDYTYPGVTTAPSPPDAELLEGVLVPGAGLGLWLYGDYGGVGSTDPLRPTERTLPWIFRNGNEIDNFSFEGTLYAAFAEDCGTPVDDNCNGRVNEACGLYALGAVCETDFDCESANCDGGTSTCQSTLCGDGLLNGSETDIDCGGACASNCALTQGCSVDADCDSNVCVDNACAAFHRPESAGDIVVTEFLANPASIDDSVGEWIELYNSTGDDLDLNGCSFTDSDGAGEQFNVTTEVLVPAGGYALVGASTNPAVNGGLSIALGFGTTYTLGNSGDEIELRCGGTLIDEVAYTANNSGYATQLSIDTLTAVANDNASNLCVASTQIPGYAEFGTPGAANTSCALSDVSCQIVTPVADFNAAVGADLAGQVAVTVPFLTDLSTGANPSPNLEVEALLVATGTDPSTVPDVEWSSTTLSGGYSAASPYAGADKYTSSIAVPDDVGNTYRYVFRTRGSGSAPWILCDPDGSTNGFTLESTAVVTIDAEAPVPTDVGQIVFTEVLVDGNNAGSIEPNEFAELRNVTPNAIQLQGCTVTSNAPSETFIISSSTIIQPGGYAIIGRADHLYPVPAGVPLIVHPSNALAFGNGTSGERVEISCPGAASNPVAGITNISVNEITGVSRQVAFSDVSNTNPLSSLTMCETPAGTFDMGLGDNGTPGFDNVECDVIAAPSVCYLSASNPTQSFVGTDATIQVRVLIPGVTDASNANNPNVQVLAEIGFGPADTDPTIDPTAFTWTAATPTSPYTTGGGTADEDQYEADLSAAAPTSGATVARFSVDGGDTFSIYCDSSSETPVLFDFNEMQPLEFESAPVLVDCFELQGPIDSEAYPYFSTEAALAIHVSGLTDVDTLAAAGLQVELGMDFDGGPPASPAVFDSWQVLGNVDPDNGDEDIYFGDITYPTITGRTIAYGYRVTYLGTVLGYCDGVDSTTFGDSTFGTFEQQSYEVAISYHNAFDVPLPASVEEGTAIEAYYVLGIERLTDRLSSGLPEAELSPLVQVRHTLINTDTSANLGVVSPTFDTSLAVADDFHQYSVSLSPGVGNYSSTFEVSVDGGLTWGDAVTENFEVTAPVGGPGDGVVTTYWINEIHYDNASGDVNEAIEIAGPPGATTPSSLQVVFYNGNGGATYGSVSFGDVTLSDDGEVGFYNIILPANTLQNGDPDGLALVGPSGLIEFISYDGSFTGVGGAANGVTSTDIGGESGSSPVGHSLQRAGTGCSASDFSTWDTSAAHTYGAVNNNQTFDCGGGDPDPDPDPVGVTTVWINEMHYDDNGGDLNEGVELMGPAGMSLDGWRVEPRNLSNNSIYSAVDLGPADSLSDEGTYGVLWVPISAFQNGAPDGVRLLDEGGNQVQFLSYEGASAGSTNIGVNETNSTPVGHSLQLTGSGCAYSDFTWQSPAAHSRDAINAGQTIVCP